MRWDGSALGSTPSPAPSPASSLMTAGAEIAGRAAGAMARPLPPRGRAPGPRSRPSGAPSRTRAGRPSPLSRGPSSPPLRQRTWPWPGSGRPPRTPSPRPPMTPSPFSRRPTPRCSPSPSPRPWRASLRSGCWCALRPWGSAWTRRSTRTRTSSCRCSSSRRRCAAAPSLIWPRLRSWIRSQMWSCHRRRATRQGGEGGGLYNRGGSANRSGMEGCQQTQLRRCGGGTWTIARCVSLQLSSNVSTKPCL
mmetsp:Transcript_16633/g.52061  ORF Transcript_16633/g.52061 Transcript_16633/m.52061 type:complete len:249 (+) Transcript_16633:1046-1792(+)